LVARSRVRGLRRLPGRLFLLPAPAERGGPGPPPATGPEGQAGDADPQGDRAGEEGEPAVPEGLPPGEVGGGGGGRRAGGLAEGLLEREAAGDPGEDGGRRPPPPAVDDVLHEGEGEGIGGGDLAGAAREEAVELVEREVAAVEGGQGDVRAV